METNEGKTNSRLKDEASRRHDLTVSGYLIKDKKKAEEEVELLHIQGFMGTVGWTNFKNYKSTTFKILQLDGTGTTVVAVSEEDHGFQGKSCAQEERKTNKGSILLGLFYKTKIYALCLKIKPSF